MSHIKMGNISLADVKDPNLTQVVTEIGEIIKLEVIQSLSIQLNRPDRSMPKLRSGGKEYNSVGTVVSSYFRNQPQIRRKDIVKNIKKLSISQPTGITRPIINRLDTIPLSIPNHNLVIRPDLAPILTNVEIPLDKHLLETIDLKQRFSFMDNVIFAGRLVPAIYNILDKIRFDDQNGSNNGTVALNKGLKFELLEVKCVDETDPEFWSSDEIAMGGLAIDDKNNSTKINEFQVGSFNDGTRRVYNPPQALHTFNLDANYDVNVSDKLQGKLFTVFLGMAEKDAGGFADFLNELYTAVKNQVNVIIMAAGAAIGAKIGATIGGSLGTSVAGPLGTVIGVVAGLVLGYIIGVIIDAFKDDIFEPQMATLYLPSHSATFGGSTTSPTNSFNYQDHSGQYTAFYRWSIVR